MSEKNETSKTAASKVESPLKSILRKHSNPVTRFPPNRRALPAQIVEHYQSRGRVR